MISTRIICLCACTKNSEMAVLTRYITSLVNSVCVLPEDQCRIIGFIVALALCFGLLFLVLNALPCALQLFDTNNGLMCRKTKVRSDRRPSGAAKYNIKDDSLSHERNYSGMRCLSACGSSLDCEVPCISCSSKDSDKLCRYILCKACCQGSKATVCAFHGPCEASKPSFISSWFQNKPTKVDLSYLSLTKCPDRVGFIGSQLHTLNLSNNNLKQLPVEIGCLLGLHNLDIRNNSINSLPDIIGNFVELKELDLSCNQLSSLPPSIGNLKCLQILNVCDNRLTQLPSNLGSLVNLTKLCVSYNKLRKIPSEIKKLSNLQVIDLKQNILQDLPDILDQLVRLEILDVSANQLNYLPPSLCRCAALTSLCVHYNRLRLIPNHIGCLHQLKCLKADHNRLCYLPTSLHSLQLYVFTVENNPLLTPEACLKEQSDIKLTFPTLSELCARVLISSGVKWENANLPSTLQGLLARVNYCVTCLSPVFENCSRRLEFRRICAIDTVPLVQHICNRRMSQSCAFIEIPEDL